MHKGLILLLIKQIIIIKNQADTKYLTLLP